MSDRDGESVSIKRTCKVSIVVLVEFDSHTYFVMPAFGM